MLPDKAKSVVCCIISLVLSFWMNHLVIGQCDTVRLSACILCNSMSLYLNCCLELKIEILKYMFRFEG